MIDKYIYIPHAMICWLNWFATKTHRHIIIVKIYF